MGARRAFRVGGTWVDAIDTPGTLHWFGDRIRERSPSTVVFCTASTIVEGQRDPALRRALSEASLVTADGMPLVWLGRRQVGDPVGRVYGPDFMKAFLSAAPGVRHFFYGGSPETLERLVSRLSVQHPSLEIAGSLSPEIADPNEIRDEDVAEINRSRADVVWVGLGHPKQELWMQRHRDLIDAPVLAGVGAAFDYLSGAKREAPTWMKEHGLQWLHRLGSEPRRLWRRYLIGNSRFAWTVMRELISRGTARETA